MTTTRKAEGEIISEESELDAGGYQTTVYDSDKSQSWFGVPGLIFDCTARLL